jgi:predicted metal-dependent phosphoesterase TrpH
LPVNQSSGFIEGLKTLSAPSCQDKNVFNQFPHLLAPKLSEQVLIRADFHIHTKYSCDASQQPKTIVEKLNAHPTLNAIAITDHNTTQGSLEAQELAEAYQDILIIPGVEISTEEGEIIILGITELPPKPWIAENVVDFAKANNGLTIAPHPYRGVGMGDMARHLDLDAIEVLNGITEPDLNRQAETLARTMGLPGVAGSDAHDDKDSWNVCTEVQASLEVGDVLKAVRKGHVRAFSI